MKWNAAEIIIFLDLYRNIPCLWDVRIKEYSNKVKKTAAYEALLKSCKDSELCCEDVADLKARIKSIRDTYRTEFNKVKKAERSGMDSDSLYTPSLVWYETADAFLHLVSVTRKRITNNVALQLPPSTESANDMSIPPKVDDGDQTETGFEDEQRNTSTVNDTSSVPEKRRGSYSPESRIPNKKRSLKLEALESTLAKIEAIGNVVAVKDENDTFGEHIAKQLKALPRRQQLLLRQRVSNLITNFILDSEDESSFTEMIVDPVTGIVMPAQ